MVDDQQLLRRYADGSEAAFTELVARHLPLVYSASLRQTGGDAHLAEDIAQRVFVDLARKAGSLPAGTVLAGWLHRATRYSVLQLLRAERRRQAREQESCSMDTPIPEADHDWEQVRPWLDETLDQMNPLDRDALLLRFFEQRSLKEIGMALGTGEDAARKRVARALDKLRELLAFRGVTTSVSALSLAMAAKGIQSAPASLAGTIAASSLAAGGTAAGISALHIIRTITMSQLKTAVLAVVAVAGITTALIQHRSFEKLRAENRSLLQQSQKLAELQAENDRLSKLLAQAQRPVEPPTELLRLRGQVGLLRDDLQKALAASRAAVSENAIPTKNEAPVDPSQPFTAVLTARLGDKQTLVTGGWSTAPGMHTFILMTPNIDAADGVSTQVATDGSKFDIPNAKIAISTCTVEVPNAMLNQFGLDQFQADGNDSSVQSILAAADAQTLLSALKTPPDGVVVSHGEITTADGISATMSVSGTEASSPNGQPVSGEYTIGLTPNLTADQAAMDLAINLRVVRPDGSALVH
ncbi:MAG TPA: sigma-70 family RNA polymerase sigma factor [Verrucomicrobiae bacterium]|jgi:RNA polymerase sigma factor (sigma-70 family)|nr:sigma-70 family RNA polymerase sigma factor [Verrucomicrobiae bacterium]